MVRHHVTRFDPGALAVPAGYEAHSRGFRRAAHVDGSEGSVHAGFATCELAPGGEVEGHVHAYEESFHLVAGSAELTVDGRAVRLEAGDCGLVPVGVEHAWRNAGDEPCRWIEMAAPQPRDPRAEGTPDTVFLGTAPADDAVALDVRDPRTRTLFRLGPGQMELDDLNRGAPVDAPTVSASMATALLAYSGIAVKMLVDQRLGAQLANMFMVEYEPGGVAQPHDQPHDHPLEECYYVLDGEVELVADGRRYVLRPGDVAWAGVGCVHAFCNRGDRRVRWLETQAPLPPAAHSYRFNRDWDYLAERRPAGRAGEGGG
ncbi:MAG: cupin domain-containing protein [Solirubrobacteraceae bacterium]|nr:cupin domain-containing protein [Solirubrobacteraceae bacterium]